MPARCAFFCSLVLTLLIALSCGQGEQQPADSSSPSMTPALTTSIDEIVPAGAKLTKVTGGIQFDTGGSPCWIDGELFFTNNIFDPRENAKTYRMPDGGEAEIIRQPNGVTTSLHNSGNGTLYCCEMIGHRVTEIDKDGNVVRTVADSYNGKRLDGPNDMVLDAKGGIYFTDSRFSPGEELVQDTPAVYYVKPDGSLIRVIDDLTFPNGVDLSPDGSILYVMNTRGPDKGEAVYAYDVNADGTVTNKRVFCTVKLTEANMAKEDGTSGADGCGVDSAGNLYVCTTQGIGIQVFNAEGTYLGDINTEQALNNMYFGGPDLKTLYASVKDGIYAIKLNIPGLPDPLK